MKTLVARKRHAYAGVYRNPGDVYDAQTKHAKVLCFVRLAEEYAVPVFSEPVAEVPQAVEVEPEKPQLMEVPKTGSYLIEEGERVVPEDKPRRGRPRKYNTRDMVAK